MSLPVRWFLRGAVFWLGVGLVLGLWMGLDPGQTAFLRTPHLHALLAGFVAFMIFGVGYHVLPRFSGRSVPWERGPLVHVALANLGLLALVGGFLGRILHPGLGRVLVPLGGVLFLVGAVIFIHAVWTLTEAPRWDTSIRKPPP